MEEIKEFNKLSDRNKWNKWSDLKGCIWSCGECGEIMEDETPERSFMGSRHCSNCGHELTRRTNGGQSDPFGWKPVLTP